MDDKLANSKSTKASHQGRPQDKNKPKKDDDFMNHINDYLKMQDEREERRQKEGTLASVKGGRAQAVNSDDKIKVQIKDEPLEDDQKHEQASKKTNKSKKTGSKKAASVKLEAKDPFKFSKEGIKSATSSGRSAVRAPQGLQSTVIQRAAGRKSSQKPLIVYPLPRNGYHGYQVELRKRAERKQTQEESSFSLSQSVQASQLPSDQAEELINIPGVSEALIRGTAFAHLTDEVSMKQVALAKTLLRNLTKQNSHVNNLESLMKNFLLEVKEVQGKPNENTCIYTMINNLAMQFKIWVLKGDEINARALKPIDDIHNSSNLLNEMSKDILEFFYTKRKHLKLFMNAFEEQLIKTANKMGMNVDTPSGKRARDTVVKFIADFKYFKKVMSFWRVFLDPYCMVKKLEPFYCAKCNSIIFSRKEVVKKQKHMAGKVFSINFFINYASKKREADHAQVKKAFNDFRTAYLKAFPIEEHPHRARYIEDVEMPDLILAGDNIKKNRHECFSSEAKKAELKKQEQAIDEETSGSSEEEQGEELNPEIKLGSEEPSHEDWRLIKSRGSRVFHDDSSFDSKPSTRVKTNNHSDSSYKPQSSAKSTSTYFRKTGRNPITNKKTLDISLHNPLKVRSCLPSTNR